MSRRLLRRAWRCMAVVVLAAAPLLAPGCAAPSPQGHVLRGTVADAANGMPVHKARVVFGGRTTTLFTTSSFTLSHLPRGEGVLTVDADGYAPWQKRLLVKGRETTIDVRLQGNKVPGLSGILVWCAWEPEALRIDIRLTDAAGMTLRHFPSLPFTGLARLSVNLGSEGSPRPGALLFEGSVPVSYDPLASLDRLKGRIPRGSIARPPASAGGMLEFTLNTPQGAFRWVRGDVPLRAGD